MFLERALRGGRSLPLDAVAYAVLDVETTGFSPRLGDRVVEIALVRMTPDATVEDEFATLVDPERDVGPTHVHGIRASDLVAGRTSEADPARWR